MPDRAHQYDGGAMPTNYPEPLHHPLFSAPEPHTRNKVAHLAHLARNQRLTPCPTTFPARCATLEVFAHLCKLSHYRITPCNRQKTPFAPRRHPRTPLFRSFPLASPRFQGYNTQFGQRKGHMPPRPESENSIRVLTAPVTHGGVFAFTKSAGTARLRPDTPSARTSGRHATTGLCTAPSGCQPPPSLTCPHKATPGHPRRLSPRPAATIAPLEVS
jgi:hypothetical protein